MAEEHTEVVVKNEHWTRNIHWPAIVAGAFCALALFTISGILARAVGLGWTFRTAMTTGEEAGAIIWGGVAALVCFGIGGYVAAKTAPKGSGAMNGFLVWAVCVPILLLSVGAMAGPMMARSSEMGPQQRLYGTPAPLFEEEQGARRGEFRDEFRSRGEPSAAEARAHAGQAAAWWALVSLVAGLIGAAGVGAAVGTGERRYIEHHRS